ncbi:MAG TPA: response regulator, partial [Nitrospirota bacterium]
MMINVLHIDDDETMGVLVKKSLESGQSGIKVVSVTSSLESLRLLLNPHDFQCVLSDYQMPEMDGMRILIELRSRGDDLPFLFLTGQGNEDIAREAFKAGAHDYFTKEVGFAHYDRIANSIEQAVRTYQSERSKADAEKKLRESQERYRMLFEKMLNAFALHEVILGSDGR